MTTLLPALLIPVFLATAAPAAKPETTTGGGHNVAVTLKVGRLGGPQGNTERTYKMLSQDGSTARMLTGWRAPIPTRSTGEGGSDEHPSTSYVYQNVGVSADLGIQVLEDGRVLVSGQVEISGVRESTSAGGTSAKAPMIGTFQQVLKVVLQAGKKLRVAEGPDPEAGTLYLDLQADLVE